MTHRPPTARAAALQIIRTLHEAGYTALLAGGCVRDMLMKRRPADFDVATDATPQQVIGLFRRTQKVGVQFGVVIVGVGPHWIEVATFRSDLEYTDGRRPSGVHFSDPQHDAARRDFTINGMFFDPLKREVIDFVGGERDIRARLIRAIGDPQERFAEDHLRMLRAVRFAARLGFAIDDATRAAIVRHAASIARVSPERICDEIGRILQDRSRALGWRETHALGLLPYLWRGADRLSEHAPQIESRLAALGRSPISLELALAAVLIPLPIPEIRHACVALRTSNQTRDDVSWLCRNAPRLREPDALSLADLKLLMAGRRFAELMQLAAADLKTRRAPPAAHRRLERRVREIAPREVAPPPLLTGDHLHAMHVPQGPHYKTILERTYYAQLNHELRTHAEARAFALQIIEELKSGFDPRRGVGRR
jgi:poly(A) polymerase